jgi:aminopeptidase N
VLNVTEATQSYVFENITCKPVPSLLRRFSAPVKLNFSYSHEELCFLMIHDSDGFNRWNASQVLANACIAQLLEARKAGEELVLPDIFAEAHQAVLNAVLLDTSMDKAMVAQLLTLPTMGSLIEASVVADVDGIYAVREFLIEALACRLTTEFENVYLSNKSQTEFAVDSGSIAQRALKNLCLSYLVRSGAPKWIEECQSQFTDATNMTDQMTALRCLVNSAEPVAAKPKADSLAAFYAQWKNEQLVVDQWFQVQAACQLPGALEKVKALMDHEDFEIKNPNKVRSLIGVFCGQNFSGFHSSTGEGYEFLADQVLALDKINPQIASRLLSPLTRWKKYDAQRGQLMLAQLERIKADENLSRDVFEVVQKSSK